MALAFEKPDAKRSLSKHWTPIKAELGGNPVPDAVLKEITLKLDNGKYEAPSLVNPTKARTRSTQQTSQME